MSVAIVVHGGDFAAWLRRAERDMLAGARQALGQSVALALYLARTTHAFKDRTGELRGSISRGSKGPWKHFLKASAKHALYVEEKTKPHPITPKKKDGWLRFVQSGVVRFAKRVHHPGTKATHFMARSAEAAAVVLVHDLDAAAARATRHS